MFGTISFTNNGQYRISNDHLFSQEENDRSTRRFACRTCRLFKVKCNRDPTTCARCCSLDIDCVYDQPTASRSQHASNDRPQSNSNSMAIESNLSSTSPAPRPSRAQDSGRRSATETLVSSLIECEGSAASNDIFAEFTLESPVFRSLQSMLSSEQQTATATFEMGFSLPGKDNSNMDLILDETDLADLGMSQGLLSLQDSARIASSQTSNDTRCSQSASRNGELDGTLNMTSPMSPPSSQPPSGGCSCLSQLSTALFALSGMLRRFDYDKNVTMASGFQEALQNVLEVTAQMRRLLDNVVCCAYRCFKKSENRVLLVMGVEQLVDLCSILVAQMELRFKKPNGGISVAVHIGGYVVDNEQERQMIFFLLISERLKALTVSSACCRDKFSVVAEAADSQARLSSAIQSLEVLRLKLGNRTNVNHKVQTVHKCTILAGSSSEH